MEKYSLPSSSETNLSRKSNILSDYTVTGKFGLQPIYKSAVWMPSSTSFENLFIIVKKLFINKNVFIY